jgi:hypothetical protein
MCSAAYARTPEEVVDLPTRPGVTQRLLVMRPPAPKAAVVLLPGGHGGLRIHPDGSLTWGEGNFLVRTRNLFAERGLMVVVVDAPSDRQSPPFLDGFRQTAEHGADLRSVIAWVRAATRLPVWLVGTSRGTQSAAYLATQLGEHEGPDGIVLTSTIVADPHERPVPAMPLDRIAVPVLVVHHEQDACPYTLFSDAGPMMTRLTNAPRVRLLTFTGGQNRGDRCDPFAYHGFNGLESDVVTQIAAWILAK